jgi:hypothetical protein
MPAQQVIMEYSLPVHLNNEDIISPLTFVIIGWLLFVSDIGLVSIVYSAHTRVLAQLAERSRNVRLNPTTAVSQSVSQSSISRSSCYF